MNLSGCGGSSIMAPTRPAPPIPTTPTDPDVLNFALNLEYLEASYYLYAATGAGLEASDTTPESTSTYQTAGTVTPGDAAAVPGLTPVLNIVTGGGAVNGSAAVSPAMGVFFPAGMNAGPNGFR